VGLALGDVAALVLAALAFVIAAAGVVHVRRTSVDDLPVDFTSAPDGPGEAAQHGASVADAAEGPIPFRAVAGSAGKHAERLRAPTFLPPRTGGPQRTDGGRRPSQPTETVRGACARPLTTPSGPLTGPPGGRAERAPSHPQYWGLSRTSRVRHSRMRVVTSQEPPSSWQASTLRSSALSRQAPRALAIATAPWERSTAHGDRDPRPSTQAEGPASRCGFSEDGLSSPPERERRRDLRPSAGVGPSASRSAEGPPLRTRTDVVVA
jgi:hypothetical protein